MKNVFFVLCLTVGTLSSQASDARTLISVVGPYKVSIEMISAKGIATSPLIQTLDYEDRSVYCNSHLEFNAGTFIATITDSETGWTQSIKGPIKAVIGHREEVAATETCSVIPQMFTGAKLVNLLFNLPENFILPKTGNSSLVDHFELYLTPAIGGFPALMNIQDQTNDTYTIDTTQIIEKSSLSHQLSVGLNLFYRLLVVQDGQTTQLLQGNARQTEVLP